MAAEANFYTLSDAMITAKGTGQTASAAVAQYKSFVKYMIEAQQEAFLENTISSTYVLLNASNYDAIAEAYKRQTDVTAKEVGLIRRTRARVVDHDNAAQWDGANYGARSAALATLAVGAPLAGIALDQGSANGAAAVAAVAAVLAATSYVVATARAHRDVKKVYWAPPTA